MIFHTLAESSVRCHTENCSISRQLSCLGSEKHILVDIRDLKSSDLVLLFYVRSYYPITNSETCRKADRIRTNVNRDNLTIDSTTQAETGVA